MKIYINWVSKFNDGEDGKTMEFKDWNELFEFLIKNHCRYIINLCHDECPRDVDAIVYYYDDWFE